MADNLYVGLNPGYGLVEANYAEDLFLETGEDTYENVVIKAGQNLPVGAVIGMIDVGGKCVLVDDGASDGSQDPYGILTHPINATSDDEISVLVKSTRRINANALVFGGTATMATMRKKLSLRGFSIRTPGYSG